MGRFNKPSLDRLERYLEGKFPGAVGACFAPKSTAVDDHEICRPLEHHNPAFQYMQTDVKQRIANMMAERKGDLVGQEDSALLEELNLMENSSDCDAESVASVVSEEIDADEPSICLTESLSKLNSFGEETLINIENKVRRDVKPNRVFAGQKVLGSNINFNNGPEKKHLPKKDIPSKLPRIPDSYKQSVKSKFEHYRKHHAFSEKNASSSTTPIKPTLASLSPPSEPALGSLSTSIPVDSLLTSPASRRNELARIILRRRQLQTPMAHRPAVDP